MVLYIDTSEYYYCSPMKTCVIVVVVVVGIVQHGRCRSVHGGQSTATMVEPEVLGVDALCDIKRVDSPSTDGRNFVRVFPSIRRSERYLANFKIFKIEKDT
jgi:hypothetical protein